jgi:hypothetical protein
MEAVNFTLRYETGTEAEKKQLCQENNGKAVDWEMSVFANFGFVGTQATLVCCPLYFERWSAKPAACYVKARKDFENVSLAAGEYDVIRVKGVLRVAEFSRVEIQDARIERLKPQ